MTVAERAEGAQETIVPDWVTESGYTEPRNVRTKVGDAEGTTRAAVLDLADGAGSPGSSRTAPTRPAR